jgi:tRNA-2-methylthio-N6-dimethylallyladenosine synthase
VFFDRLATLREPHPKDFSADLIDLAATEPKFAKHLHIPMQSGSTRILTLMNASMTVNGM